MKQSEAEAIWSAERAAQIDWMSEQTRARRYPDGPYTRPCPEMTVPPPFSPEFYRRYTPDPPPSSDWYLRGLQAAC